MLPKQLILFVLLLSLWACNAHKGNPPLAPEKASHVSARKKQVLTVQYLKHTLLDSIIHYGNLTNIERHDDSDYYVFYMTVVNNRKIAVIAITDSTLFLFQNLNNKWLQTDSLPFDDYTHGFSITDLNGDGKDDFIVYGFPNMHGQSRTFIFLYKNNILHYRTDLDLYNIEYDKKKKMVRSYYYGSAYGKRDKEYYCWEGDSLRLFRGIEKITSDSKNDLYAFYKLKNGKKFIYRKVRDDSETVFDTALWKD